jgi:hypothetical protein
VPRSGFIGRRQTAMPSSLRALVSKRIRTTLDIHSHMIRGQEEEDVQKWEEYQRQSRQVSVATKSV